MKQIQVRIGLNRCCETGSFCLPERFATVPDTGVMFQAADNRTRRSSRGASRRFADCPGGICVLLLGVVVSWVAVSGCSGQKQQARSLLIQAGDLQQQNRHADALKLLDRAVALDDRQSSLHVARGVSQLALGQTAAAELSLRAAVRIDPDQPKAWWLLGTACRSQNRMKAALEALSHAIRQDAGFTEARFDRACLLETLGRTDEALQDLTAVLTAEPNHQDALFRHARLAAASGDLPLAMQSLNRLLRQDVRSHSARFERARVRRQAGDLDRALADVTVACRLAPQRWEYRQLRAELLQELDRPREAAADCLRVFRLCPDRIDMLRQAAHLFGAAGDRQQALTCITDVIESAEASPEDRVLRANLYRAAGDRNAEIRDLEEAWRAGAADGAVGTRLVHLRMQQGRISEALSLSSELLARDDTDHADLLQVRIRALTETEQLTAAMEACGRLAQFEDFRSDALKQRMLLAVRQELWSQAIDDFRELQQHDPDAAQELERAYQRARLNRAAERLAAGDVPGAIRDTSLLLEHDPEHTEALRLRAPAWISAGNAPAALEDLTCLFALEPQMNDDPELRWLQAVCLMHLNRTEGLHDCLAAVIQRDPDHQSARFARASLLEQEGRIQEALRDLEYVKEASPRAGDALWLKARLLQRLGRSQDARTCAAQAVRLLPDRADVHLTYALILLRTEDIEAAERELDRVLECDASSADGWYWKGNLLAARQERSEAIACYRNAVRHDRDHSAAWYNCGNLLFEQQEYEAAIRCWDEAVRIDPDLARAWNNRAAALLELGRDLEAVQDYRRALQCRPDFVRAYDNLAWLLIRSRYPDIRDAAEALELARTACELTGYADWECLRTLAWCCAETGRYHQAQTILQQAIRHAPESRRGELSQLSRTWHRDMARRGRRGRRRS